MRPYAVLNAVLCSAVLLLSACGGAESPPGAAALPAPQALAPAVVKTVDSRVSAQVVAQYQDVLQRIYVGYFGRPSDPAGLAYWSGQYQASGAPTTLPALLAAYASNATVRSLVDTFSSSQESRDLYGGDNDAFISAIYRNLFNREPDAAGKAYWVSQLDAGRITRALAALSIMAGAQSTDITTVDNKVLVSINFTVMLDTPERVASYDGLAANAVVRTMLKGVDRSTTLPVFALKMLSTVNTLVATSPAVRYKLTVSQSGGGQGTVSPATASYAKGTRVTVRAQPHFFSDFRGWTSRSSGCVGVIAGCIFDMDKDNAIEARFEPTSFVATFTATYQASRVISSTRTCTWAMRWTEGKITFRNVLVNGAYQATMRVQGNFQPSSTDSTCTASVTPVDRTVNLTNFGSNGFSTQVEIHSGASASEYLTVTGGPLGGPVEGRVNNYSFMSIRFDYKGTGASGYDIQDLVPLYRRPFII